MTSLKDLLTETEQRWQEVLEARRRASAAEKKWKDALYAWYEQQEGEADAE